MALTARTSIPNISEPPEGTWELIDGQLREKPTMSVRHHDVCSLLGYYLMDQLDLAKFRVHINGSRLARTAQSYFIPDLAVIPVELLPPDIDNPRTMDYYEMPLPLVAEVWSPSTGGYDIDAKLPEYRARKDREIWRIHAYDRSLIAWRRQPDGTYDETHYHEGTVVPASLPGVAIELAALFI